MIENALDYEGLKYYDEKSKNYIENKIIQFQDNANKTFRTATTYANGATTSINDLVTDGIYRIYILENSDDHNYLGFYGQTLVETFSQGIVICQRINEIATGRVYFRYTSNQTTAPLSYSFPLIDTDNIKTFSNIKVGANTISADSKTDTLTFEGSNVTISSDTTNDKVTFGITKDNVTTALGYTPVDSNKVLTKSATDTWDAIPYIDDIGVMEVGKYIDFHITDGNTADSDVRIIASTDGLAFSGKTTLNINKSTWLYNGESRQGYLGNSKQGTTEVVGNTRLILGNNVASGNDNNASGNIYLYGENTGFTLITPTNNATSDITLNLPSANGTIGLLSDIPWTRSAGFALERRVVGIHGFITSGGTEVYLYLPMIFDRSVSYSSSTFNISRMLGDIRTVEGTILGGALNIDLTSYITETYSYLHQGLIRVILTKSDGWGVKNNTPLCGDCTIDYTIS